MISLRSSLIRLAHANPELRQHLLPVLADRVAKSEFEGQFDKANHLDAVDPAVAKLIVDSGLDDGGDAGDDKITVSPGSWTASTLKPSQTTMVLGKALGMAIGMLSRKKIGGDLGAMLSSDNHILDGHHRWAATILASGSKHKVGGYKANLKGPDLLRVLNIISKGAFNVRGGNPGKGSISEFTPDNVKKALTEMTEKGIGGEFPISAEKVKETLKKSFGSVEKGLETVSGHADLIDKNVPGWAPDRKQMPVIAPEQVQEAADLMNSGNVDWHAPYKQAALRSSLIRLAHANPELRPHLLPLLKP